MRSSAGAGASTSASSVSSLSAEFEYGSSAVQGVRDNMEDEVLVHFNEEGKYLYAAVFDGHGGEAAAQWLSKQLQRTVHTSITVGEELAATSERLVDSFHQADKELLAHLESIGGEVTAGSGATATVVLVKDGRMVVANVGDSEAVLSRKGVAVPLARRHRVYGSGPEVQAEIDRIKATGGWVDDGRVCSVLAVSRAFGDWEFKGEGLKRLLQGGIEKGFWDGDFAAQQSFTSDPVIVTPDVSETILSEDDEFLIVASDGLWDVLPPREAVAWARKEFKAKRSASEVAQSLTGLALKRYTTDNVGVVVIDLKGADVWGAKPQKAKRKGLLGGLFSSAKA